MYKLIRKDILIQKRTLFIAFAYAVVIYASFSRTDASRYIFNMGSIAIAYFFISNSLSYDDKNNCLMVISSLPVKRGEIVVAKYLSLILFGLFGVVMMGVFGYLVRLTGIFNVQIDVNAYSIMKVFIILLLMYSVFYPLYFKFGYLKLNLLNMLLFLMAIFGMAFINYIFTAFSQNFIVSFFIELIGNYSQFILYIITLLSVLLLTIFSAVISLRIYNSKNL